jgi:heme/copper-type cytochrome/quinol oxidase subunit 2
MIKKNFLYVILSIFIPNLLNACAVCYGAPEDPITQSLNTAMLFMLGIVFFVLSCIVYSIFTLIKRSSNIQT